MSLIVKENPATADVPRAAMHVYYDVHLSINLLMLLVLIILTSLLAVGIGMWMSVLNVKFRDVRYALPFLIQLGLFASPIIYPSSLVPDKWRWLCCGSIRSPDKSKPTAALRFSAPLSIGWLLEFPPY